MHKVYKCLRAKSDITGFHLIEDSLVAYSTKFHGIKIFDLDDCDVKKSIANAYLNSSTGASAFSPDSSLFAFVNDRTIFILEMDSKELTHTIEVNDEDIEIISFDPTSTYIIAGTKNGRVLQYKVNSSSLLSRLCSFPYNRDDIVKKQETQNYVSAFAFYGNLFACSGCGGAIYVLDLYAQTGKSVIIYNKARINAMVFLDKDTLACAKADGKVDIVNIDDELSHKSIQTPIPSLENIIAMPNQNYIMLSGNSPIITIADVKNFKIAHSKYIVLDTKVKHLLLTHSDSLTVALQNNEIVHVELPGIAKLRSLMLRSSLKEAFELIDKEPMLQDSNEHKVLQKRFEKSYEAALNYLINQNKAQAEKVLAPYKDVRSKQEKIKELFSAFEHYLRFQALVLERKYALAYAMCSKYEPLKRTAPYKKMESIFKDAFTNAQRHIVQNDIPSARALLWEYSSIASKKPLIKLLLTQNKEFVELLRAIGKRDFRSIDALVAKNELFRQIPNYIALNTQVQESIDDIEQKINSGEITKAKQALIHLRGVEHAADKTKELQNRCKYAELLYEAYNRDDFKECYELLDLHRSLRETELGALLEKHWSSLMQKCEEYALEGNIKDIKKSLGELMRVSTRYNKIGDLLRVSFHVRIESLQKEKNYNGAEAIIYTYIDIFGLDSEIESIMKKFEGESGRKLAITQTNDDRPTRDSWRFSEVIMKGL